MALGNAKVKNGTVLLAEPFLWDSNFKRAAILVCEHNKEGSVGFIMNKKIDMRIDELIADFPEFSAEVLFGGPVQTDTIHYIHNVGELLDDSIKIADGLWWGGDFEKLKFLISSEMVQEDNIRFFVGYSGWSGGQLNDEMSFGTWLTAQMDANYLFKSRAEYLWSKIMANKGDRYSVIAEMPEGVTWN